MKIPSILTTISKKLHAHNAKAIIVGGCVRDYFLQLPIKDYDIEVYGLESLSHLETLLLAYGSVNLVGKSFGVLKFYHNDKEYDFSFPRTEVKKAIGHKGFDVFLDGSVSYDRAAKRRDFTINSLGYDIETQKFLDPFNGLYDIKMKRLRHIDPYTFMEDPLRIYRAMQFCGRFEFVLTEETKMLCRYMISRGVLEELPKERVYEEWKKLLLKSHRPSKGFECMKELGMLERYFPELHALIGVPQSPKWHPEGDVWRHTMMALDRMQDEISHQAINIQSKQKLKFLFAILCHDLGKATHTTIEDDGTIRSIGHEKAGLKPTVSLLYRLMNEHDFIQSLLPLVEHHLKPSQFYNNHAKSSAIRKLAMKVKIEELVIVAKADFLGRSTKEAVQGIYYAGEWLLEKARVLQVESNPMPPLVQGRDLIALGMKPSKKFKEILEEIYRLQIDGKIKKKREALNYLKRVL